MPRDINCIEDMVKARDEAQSDLGNMISRQQKDTGWSISSRSTIFPTAIENHQDMVKISAQSQQDIAPHRFAALSNSPGQLSSEKLC